VEKYSVDGHATDDNIIWCIQITCWATRTTDSHSVFVILNAFLRQQWLRERSPQCYVYMCIG